MALLCAHSSADEHQPACSSRDDGDRGHPTAASIAAATVQEGTARSAKLQQVTCGRARIAPVNCIRGAEAMLHMQ